MRIGFTGAGGTGKTTLAKGLALNLNLPFQPSPARPAMAAHGLHDEETMLAQSPDQLWEYQRGIFLKKLEQDETFGPAVSDRTLLDCWGYCTLFCWRSMSDAVVDAFETLVSANIKYNFDLVFQCRPHHLLNQRDGVRLATKSYAMTFDAIIDGTASRNGLPLFTVPPGTVEERLAWIQQRVAMHQDKQVKE